MSVLNEITYSNNDLQSTGFVDTPAKLKLRANAFGNIQKAMQAKNNDFHIPDAYMAMDMSTSSDGDTGNGGIQIKDSGLEGQFPLGSPMTKRLKVKDSQIGPIKSAGVTATNVPEYSVHNEIPDNPTTYQNSTSEVVPTTPDVVESPISFMNQANAIDMFDPSSVSSSGGVEEYYGTYDDEHENDVGIDDVVEEEAILPPELEAQEKTKEAFDRLTQATVDYRNMCDVAKEREDALKSAQKRLKDLQKEYAKKGEILKEKEANAQSKIATISKYDDQTDATIEEIYAVNQEINARCELVTGMLNSCIEKKMGIDESIEETDAKAQEMLDMIRDRDAQIASLDEKGLSLEKEEKFAFKRRDDTIKELADTKKRLDSIPIPTLEKLAAEKASEAVATKKVATTRTPRKTSTRKTSTSKIVSMPKTDNTMSVMNFPTMSDVDNSYEEESGKVYSYKKAA